MKIDFQETTKDLAVRIDIHSKFGARDIDRWMLDLIKLQPESKILDVGCGSGKQCFSYWDELSGKADITGGDVSGDLLSQAKAENDRRNAHIQFDYLDFNQPFHYAMMFLISFLVVSPSITPKTFLKRSKKCIG